MHRRPIIRRPIPRRPTDRLLPALLLALVALGLQAQAAESRAAGSPDRDGDAAGVEARAESAMQPAPSQAAPSQPAPRLYSAADASGEFLAKASREVREAYLVGKLNSAYALRPELNPLDIRVGVDGDTVLLQGRVDSVVEKDLAAEIAKGMTEVSQVRNELRVAPGDPRGSGAGNDASANAGFAQAVSDAATTAQVKTRLLASDSTEGMAIDVDTQRSVVTLSGAVDSPAQSEMAETIARKTDGVIRVVNALQIHSDKGQVARTPY